MLEENFEPTGLGKSVFEERYAQGDETWAEACRRVARAIAAAEENGNVAKYEERFYEELVNGRLQPGGRIWYGAGRRQQSMLNCFVIDCEDSREGWAKGVGDMMITSGVGGGVGCNFSKVRGRGYEIRGTGGVATGAVSIMQMFDRVGDILVSGGGRRLALMLCLDIDHPDIEEFLEAKLDRDELNNANISVVLPEHISSEELVRLVKEDGDIELQFNGVPDRFGRTIKARDFWNKLVQNAWECGEPGLLNVHAANKMNNISYAYDLPASNPCGEQFLPPGGSCNLGHLVLPRFVKNGKVDWDQLDESVRLGVRFHDNVIDVNHYPIPYMADVATKERRIGFGVMGLHSMLLDLGMPYNSPEALKFTDRLFNFIKNTAYDTSINLAIEKGPFALYKSDYANTGFAKTLKRGIRNKIKEYGIRNCALLTVAPTGTTSMVQGVTGGIEPLFSPVYIRRRKVIDNMAIESKKRTLVVSKEYLDHPSLVQGAYDITPREHMEMQKICQKHVDSSISKTINLPEDFPVEDLSELWLEYLPHVKGTTFYRQGSRGEEPMEHVPAESMSEMVDNWDEEIEYEIPDVMDCPGGVCELKPSAVEVSDPA